MSRLKQSQHLQHREGANVSAQSNPNNRLQLQVQYPGYNQPKTVQDLIRDISGATFNDPATIDNSDKMHNRNGRASSAAKSHATTKTGERGKSPTMSHSTGKRTAASMPRGPLKTVGEIYGASKNAAKFCLPLGFTSARELEVVVQKEKEHKEEQKKKKKSQKPQLNSKQIHKILVECAKKRFPTDPRQHGKFTEIA